MQMSLLHRDHRAITMWLTVSLLLVTSMVFIGGYTRLSGSGLSITEWKPIHGVIPPLNESEWTEEFAAYQASPQYQKINRGMTLEEFKTIYWPEYFHRLLGRAIGAVFFIPFFILLMRRSLTPRLAWRLAGIFALGGLQGLVGWLMVKSGLIDNPHVSHLKLAMHLALAFAVSALLLWTILDILRPWMNSAANVPEKSGFLFKLWFAGLCIQILLGAMVAGLHAGLIYNSWPTMNGQWIPDELLSLSGTFLDSPVLLQFLHRKLAILLAVSFLFWWYFQRPYVKNYRLGKVCAGVAAVIAIQFLLGVLTLIREVPLWLALAHQMTALTLFALAVILLHGLKRHT